MIRVTKEDKYIWKVLTPEQAANIWYANIFEVYALYDDDSDALIENANQLHEAIDKGITLGVEVGLLSDTEEQDAISSVEYDITREQYLALPERGWSKITCYDAIVVVPTRHVHDSGWGLMAIVGCNERWEPVEIAAYCDDIQWIIEKTNFEFRTDMFFKSKCLRFHSREFKFRVGLSLSTTEIKMVKR